MKNIRQKSVILDYPRLRLKIIYSNNTKNRVGTTRWRAPEIFKRDKPTPNKSSDIYSYGMILWELSSRKLPFKDAPDEITAMSWIKREKGKNS